MNLEFIDPFIKSTLNVLQIMAQTDATPGQPVVKSDHKANGDVTGIIGMIGEQAKVSLSITFTAPAILSITSNMLGETIEVLDETAFDAVGEITNMITGGSKKLLAEKGYKFDLSSPSVIAGKDHIIIHQLKAPIVIIPFSTDAGDFFLEICSLCLYDCG
ncbi:chemotaxis protein CheX [Candidatus Magnetominusculus dajiuhuensis]|uniref:chemotaxis protein CheX n=1 Tax=Candidatus Magnetominusculus dajiuhuensis TaxID=3137712 RepID=UPI003B434813